MPTRRPIFVKDSLLISAFALVWVAGMVMAALATDQSITLVLLCSVVVPFLFWCAMIGFVVYVHHTHVKVSWHDDRSAWAKAQPFVSTHGAPHLSLEDWRLDAPTSWSTPRTMWT
jgi:acyl-lipid omega-6 desaturase (Delta-12 desaturase)